MNAPPAALSAAEVIALGGWHRRYARVVAVAQAGEYGFALVDDNGDGSELEAEHWFWDWSATAGRWRAASRHLGAVSA